jgi:hypothetical protein
MSSILCFVFQGVVLKLNSKQQAHAVVLFTTQEQALKLFQALKRLGQGRNFNWVGGDSIAMNPHTFSGLEEVVAGTLSVNFVSAPVGRFEDHFKYLTLRNGSR